MKSHVRIATAILLVILPACQDLVIELPTMSAAAPECAAVNSEAPSASAACAPLPSFSLVAGWDRVLADTSIVGDVVVPSGARWLIGRNVQVRGNVRTVGGTIGMRAGSKLTFVGADPAKYVGGGTTYDSRFVNDYGVWIGGTGVLDIQCTPKKGWNRTGTDATWKSTDEFWISPTAAGDFVGRRWFPGQAIPRMDSRVPAAEVINVTRDCEIAGPGHIHINSSRPQRIEYVLLRRMGITQPATLGGSLTTGRYALHLHFMGDGGRGTIIRGVASIDAEGRVFVPHASHGVTMIDNVSVNSFGDAFWWDPGDHTRDILVDGFAVIGVHAPRAITGNTSRTNGVVLSDGQNMVIRNAAISGVRGSKLSTGFDWPGGDAVWTFELNNIAHNNEGPGIRFWMNNRAPHIIRNFIAYRNEAAGIEHGAYLNAAQYFNVLLLENQLTHHPSARSGYDGVLGGYRGIRVEAAVGQPAIAFGRLRLTNGEPTVFENCVFRAGTGAPRFTVDPLSVNPLLANFTNCAVRPSDFSWPSPLPVGLEGSKVVIRNADGTRYTISVLGGRVTVQNS